MKNNASSTLQSHPDHLKVTSDIVAAYVSRNHVPMSDLGGLIGAIHAALASLRDGGPAAPAEKPMKQPGAAEIRKSVRQDGLVSFIDGRSYQTLKRHLTTHGLTPATYCARYGLPADYPMTAPAYSERRSNLAKAIGLGVPGGQSKRQKAGRKVA